MMIYTGMLIAGITAGYICLERHRPVEGILLLAGIAGSFAAISEQMGKEYGMTRKQLRVMLLFFVEMGGMCLTEKQMLFSRAHPS